MSEASLTVGTVGRAHGLRGAFFVSGRPDPIPPSYAELRIGLTWATSRAAAIRTSIMQADRPLLICSLADDRTSAEALTGQTIFVARRRVPDLSAGGAMLWSDLPGAVVEDVAGVSIGKVHHVYNAGASDVIEVHDERGRSVDIPLISSYLDLSQPCSSSPDAARRLRLNVLAKVFEEVWHDQTGQPSPRPEGRGEGGA